MIQDMLCEESQGLLEVIRIINRNAKGIVFVHNEKGEFVGTITDGDIRRAIIVEASLDLTAKDLIYHNSLTFKKILDFGKTEGIDEKLNQPFVSASINTPISALIKIALENEKVKIIPLLNEQEQVVDYFEYKNNLHFPIATPFLGGNELNYLLDAVLSTWISSSGIYINRFEEAFSKFCDVDYGVAVSNGTVALHLAMVTLGIGPGDEVILPDFTFAATINTVLHTNATPVIVDIDENSWCIDPEQIEKAITPKTKAIIPVHIYGQPCDMDAIMKIAKKHNLYVIEDCAEAHGAKYKGQKVGSIGDVGCFSFFANKIITTGEGGMCVTKSKELFDKMQVLRDHGMNRNKKYWHDIVGYNYRMTNLQAAIGLAQLERISDILAYRKDIEIQYKNVLSKFGFLSHQRDIADSDRVIWLVNVTISGDSSLRDKYMQVLKDNKIDCRPFFYPLSEMDVYKKYLFSNKISRKVSAIGISLPTALNMDNNIYTRISEVFGTIAEGNS